MWSSPEDDKILRGRSGPSCGLDDLPKDFQNNEEKTKVAVSLRAGHQSEAVRWEQKLAGTSGGTTFYEGRM
jgi:hypothetical protein